MKKLIILIYIIFLANMSWSQTQNKIANGNFEHLNDFPDDQAQMDRCSFWEDDMSEWTNPQTSLQFYAHSPDLYYKGHYYYGGAAASGQGYAGMMNYECMNTPVTLTEGYGYMVSMKIKLKTSSQTASSHPWSNSSLRVILGKKNMEYRRGPVPGSNSWVQDFDCNDPAHYSQMEDAINQDIVEVYRKPLNLTDFPSSDWHLISFAFKAPPDHAVNINGYYDYIGFELVSNNTSSCHDGYLLLDDIWVTDMCDNYCLQYPDPIFYGYYELNANGTDYIPHYGYISNTATALPAHTYIQNATDIDFKIWGSWTTDPFYTYHSFDPNGIKDPPDANGVYSDVLLYWHGKMDNGGCLNFADVFPYELKIHNCTEYITHTGFIYYEPNPDPNIGCRAATPYNNHEIDYCCELYKDFPLWDFYGETKTERTNYVRGGFNGLITFKAGSTTLWKAGNYIELGPNYISEPNADVIMTIAPCGVDGRMANPITGPGGRSNQLVSKGINTEVYTSGNLTIGPNPAISNLKIMGPDASLVEKIEVYDLNSKLLSSINNSTSIILDGLPTGIYIARIIKYNGEVVNKKFVKR